MAPRATDSSYRVMIVGLRRPRSKLLMYCWLNPDISANCSWVRPFFSLSRLTFRPTSLRISCAGGQRITSFEFIRSFLEQRPFDEVSIGIAHELSHLVLDSIKHPLRHCEKAVDLTAMMLGFRRLFATGTYKEIRHQNHLEVRQQGYLSHEVS